MNVMVILEVTTALLLIVSVICCGYVRYLGMENERLTEGLKRVSADLESVKAKQRVYEKRLHMMDKPEKVIILSPDKEVNYGEF